ncbi:MAG TPA: peptidoglycan DD-metalloendopeptidase family protein [Bradyrhizobium sp.]|jgi:murein DD-endopeptidase MepM/ murein hydrolase activator NlpD
MSRAGAYFGSRRVPHLAALALISFGVAGCSADMSSRLSNPFNYQGESTGTVQQPPAPQAQVERHELPQYSHSAYQSSSLPPPAVSAPQSYSVMSPGVAGGGRGMASYAPPAKPKLETTASVPPRSVAAARPAGNTTIIVGTSDTLEVLARRYRVAPAAILAANGYKGPRTLSPGQSLIIPHSPAVAAAQPVAGAPVAAAPVSRPVAAVAAPPSVHIVNPGETLASIARHNHITVGELARANNLGPTSKLKLGARLTVPSKVAAAAPATPLGGVAAAPAVTAIPAAGTKVAAAAPQQSARLAQANPPPEAPAAEAPIKASEATGALPTFRWPVRGKVIAGYGAKTNGKSNDGINLAVPEGTPVKAAEDGVVAYSGNELKGYGNLILVRHSNGYVTAYAHASELLVKRGDTIKRGQVIAKSGQSGEVGSPQLHFEIRKGSQPVDPLQFLSGA